MTKPQANQGRMSLHDQRGRRKYLTTAERRRFLRSLDNAPDAVRLFGLVLVWSGARISEVLALTPADFDLDAGVVSLVTLKRRRPGVVRQVPLPPAVLHALDRAFRISAAQRYPARATQRLWSWSRTTGWRRVKEIMESAQIAGTCAAPKGLRHAFGVEAFHKVPPHLVQRWLGHASLRTTAIYGDVMGAEEQAFAARLWSDTQNDDADLRGTG